MSERTSPEIASIASRGLRRPETLTADEIRAVCASALTQAEEPEPDEAETPRGPGFVIEP